MARPCVNRARAAFLRVSGLAADGVKATEFARRARLTTVTARSCPTPVVRQALSSRQASLSHAAQGASLASSAHESEASSAAGGTIVLEKIVPGEEQVGYVLALLSLASRPLSVEAAPGHPEERDRAGQPRFHVPRAARLHEQRGGPGSQCVGVLLAGHEHLRAGHETG